MPPSRSCRAGAPRFPAYTCLFARQAKYEGIFVVPFVRAAGVLFPFFNIVLSPVFAAAAMGLSSMTVVANALRLRKIRFKD